MGTVKPEDGKSDTLFQVTKDSLLRLGLNFNDLRGHCFDGARNMSGCINGVQKQIEKVQPKFIFVHCSNHTLDSGLQEIAKSNNEVNECLVMVRGVEYNSGIFQKKQTL